MWDTFYKIFTWKVVIRSNNIKMILYTKIFVIWNHKYTASCLLLIIFIKLCEFFFFRIRKLFYCYLYGEEKFNLKSEFIFCLLLLILFFFLLDFHMNYVALKGIVLFYLIFFKNLCLLRINRKLRGSWTDMYLCKLTLLWFLVLKIKQN